MNVGQNSFVTLDYILTLDSGEEVDRSETETPFGFVVGAGHIVPGLEKALIGMEPGQSATVVVEPVDGYGDQEPGLVQEIPLSEFPEGLQVQRGMTFAADGPEGPAPFVVTDVDGKNAHIDFNHPLAGQRLHFEITVKDVRPATEEDLHSCGDDCGCDDEEESDGCGGGGCSCR